MPSHRAIAAPSAPSRGPTPAASPMGSSTTALTANTHVITRSGSCRSVSSFDQSVKSA